jgi:selenide, water dikinase
VAPEMAEIFFDPQTSGGLLIALPESQALPLLAELQAGGNLEAAVIGRVVEQNGCAIELV